MPELCWVTLAVLLGVAGECAVTRLIARRKTSPMHRHYATNLLSTCSQRKEH